MQKVYIAATVMILMITFSIAAAAADRVVVVPLNKANKSPLVNSFTNSIGMTFNLIQADSFQMGSPIGEPGRDAGETPHGVTLTRSFYMQTTEVTSAQWNIIIVTRLRGINPSTPSSHLSGRFPVNSVTWFDAAVFANYLSSDEGRIPCYNGNFTCSGRVGQDWSCDGNSVTIVAGCNGYLLPTEAQWEFAARAGTSTAFANPVFYDSDITEMEDGFNANLYAMGWYGFNNYMKNESGDDAYRYDPKPVAMKQANSWGLYDMHGNVREWVSDWHAAYPAVGVVDPEGPASGTWKVSRGGHHANWALFCRSARRVKYDPDDRRDAPGFRLILPQ